MGRLGLARQNRELVRAMEELAAMADVHALTDVTGFGLLGHLLEVCRGSKLGATVRFDQVPTLSEALPLVQRGIVAGAIARNLASYGHEVDFAAGLPQWQRQLLADPQTSGGLLVSVAPGGVEKVLAAFRAAGFAQAAVVGEMAVGAARVAVV